MEKVMYSLISRRIVISILLIFLASGYLQAQEGDPSANEPQKEETGTPDDDLSGSHAAMKELNITPAYFMRHDAFRYAEKYKTKSREDVIKLKRLVDIFGTALPETQDQFVSIQNEYRSGMQKYYMSDYQAAIQFLEKARRDAKKLLYVFADKFKKDTETILEECSRNMVDRDLSLVSSGGGAVSASEEFVKSQQKLRMAYQQYTLAENKIRDDNPEAAIEHYRLAKLHAINIILDLQEDNTKKREMAKQYKTDLIDAYGVQQPPVSIQ